MEISTTLKVLIHAAAANVIKFMQPKKWKNVCSYKRGKQSVTADKVVAQAFEQIVSEIVPKKKRFKKKKVKFPNCAPKILRKPKKLKKQKPLSLEMFPSRKVK